VALQVSILHLRHKLNANADIVDCAPARCHGKRGQSETDKFRHITGQTVTFKHYQPDLFQEQWYLTIEAYSWRGLTNHKDRLLTIAAMAK
jgi:hypothetical protein